MTIHSRDNLIVGTIKVMTIKSHDNLIVGTIKVMTIQSHDNLIVRTITVVRVKVMTIELLAQSKSGQFKVLTM